MTDYAIPKETLLTMLQVKYGKFKIYEKHGSWRILVKDKVKGNTVIGYSMDRRKFSSEYAALYALYKEPVRG